MKKKKKNDDDDDDDDDDDEVEEDEEKDEEEEVLMCLTLHLKPDGIYKHGRQSHKGAQYRPPHSRSKP